ncbi:MAG: molecular chaperone DnaK [Myxococcales bacterium]|nr:molecular chaperone DnaK [Myxococcales bacterium]
MDKVIGIDLGTTNSCVCMYEGGVAHVIPNSEGSRTTPSMVAFTPDGQRLVGNIAKRQAVANPQNTVFATKRMMGRKLKSPEVQRMQMTAPFKIGAVDNGDACVLVHGKRHTPPEVGAFILRQLRDAAQEYIESSVKDAVITVPAYFDDSQRQATRDAGRLAGLNVVRIINEPTAAALAYGINAEQSGTIAVYDLGGGTFDISVLEFANGVFQVKATHGDTFLGGEDIDARLVDAFIEGFRNDTSIDLHADPVALQRLKDAAERAKIELSTIEETEISLPFLTADATGPKHLRRLLTRTELEQMTQDLVDQTIMHCKDAIEAAGIQTAQITDVLLVGGMTKMPLVQKAVADFFGRQPNRTVNPDEAVAVGAAIQGAILAGDVGEVVLLDVNPLSLGIETAGGVFTKLIPRNVTVPCSVTEVFTTSEDYQPLVNIHVLQGERPMATDNTSLARFELVGIPPALRGVPKIEVTFSIDANGILSVSARDLGTKREQQIRVRATSGLTESAIERILSEAEQYVDADRMNVELSEARRRITGLVYTTERSLAESANYLTEGELNQIRSDLEGARRASETTDLNKIQGALRDLEKSAFRITEVMYKDFS